jgi:hypothetical protein
LVILSARAPNQRMNGHESCPCLGSPGGRPKENGI